jgi:IS5 family transposase
VFVSEQRRGMTRAIKRELRRRSAVELVIGHMNSDHRMDRNFLIGRHGDANNAVLAAVGYNFARLHAWPRQIWCALLLLAVVAMPARMATGLQRAASPNIGAV